LPFHALKAQKATAPQARQCDQAPPGVALVDGSLLRRQIKMFRSVVAVFIFQPLQGIQNRAHKSIHLNIGPRFFIL
jgi:hypothetical protein